jgi:hypothetical protein
MSKKDGEVLRVPMLQCLKRITKELADKFQDVNKFVEEKTGKKLNLELISVVQKAEDDFRIKVRGTVFTKRITEEEFQVVWWIHTCPAHFYLLQWDQVAFGRGHNFLYSGVIEAKSEVLAKEIAIYTHHEQIPRVLSRI